jgi:tetratricopeptide (TPR) repeat protein
MAEPNERKAPSLGAPAAAGSIDDDQNVPAILSEAVDHHRRGDLDRAMAGYFRALALDPDNAQGFNNLGVALRSKGLFQAAVICYRRALAVDGDNAGAHSNLGNALRALGRFEEAAACHREAIALDPKYVEARYNLGLALKDNRRHSEGLAHLSAVVKLKPDHVDAHWDRALAWLTVGDLTRGFAEYEWRWRLPDHSLRRLEKPLWTGGSLRGQCVLVHAEQGFGDTIHFARYAPILAEQADHVILECQAPLSRLLATIDGIEVIGRTKTLPYFDVHTPLLSVPRLVGTTLETIPAHERYLRAPEPNISAARGAVAEADGFKVGIAWAGSVTHRNDRNRSAGIEPFIELCGLPGTTIFSLQMGTRAGDLDSAGCRGFIRDLSPHLTDFAETAAAIEALDLVITVDTAVAHLAGALGKPAWVVLPYNADWRWLLDRDDSPWYPSLRLFRQRTFGDWEDVFARVAMELAGQRSP